MSLELVNTLTTFATFMVIAAAAIAAIVQLRHARGSNQIAAINEIREIQGKPEFQAAFDFVFTQLTPKVQDPTFRHFWSGRSSMTDETTRQVAQIRMIGNFYESMVFS
jgi:hypothetical protein